MSHGHSHGGRECGGHGHGGHGHGDGGVGAAAHSSDDDGHHGHSHSDDEAPSPPSSRYDVLSPIVAGQRPVVAAAATSKSDHGHGHGASKHGHSHAGDHGHSHASKHGHSHGGGGCDDHTAPLLEGKQSENAWARRKLLMAGGVNFRHWDERRAAAVRALAALLRCNVALPLVFASTRIAGVCSAGALCVVFMIGEVIGGYLAHSLAIMTEYVRVRLASGPVFRCMTVAPVCPAAALRTCSRTSRAS
jgi:hypothetical protein